MIKLFLGRTEHLRDLLEKYGPQSLLAEVIGEEMRYEAYFRSFNRDFALNKKTRNRTTKHRGRAKSLRDLVSWIGPPIGVAGNGPN
jgi:hypothetical protein